MLFGSKTLQNAQKFGSKTLNDAVQFGHKHHVLRKFANTMDTIDKYAQPVVKIGSVVQPEYAPALQTAGVVINKAKQVGDVLRKFD